MLPKTIIMIDTNKLMELETFNSRIQYLDTHATKWNTISIIGKYKNALGHIVENIKEVLDPEEYENIMSQKSLRQMKLELALKMDILDDTLEAYADTIGNEDLFYKASNTKGDYFSLPYEAFERKVRGMIKLLQKHVIAMSEYGMTNEQIADAIHQFTLYEQKRGIEVTYPMKRDKDQKSLEEMFEVAKYNASKLDKTMRLFKNSDLVFYRGYETTIMYIEN